MKAEAIETEEKQEEDLQHLSDVLRKTYSSYQDLLNRISLDIRTPNNLIGYLYTQPQSTFSAPPEKQNEALGKLSSHISKVASTPPITLYPDELQKRMHEAIGDGSGKEKVKTRLAQSFRRRVDSLDIQRYRVIQRLGKCLLRNEKPEFTDSCVLVANAALDNLRLQSLAALNRFERLKNDDAFDPSREKPKILSGGIYEERKTQGEHSLIRPDDIDVYLRITLPRHKKGRNFRKLVVNIGWLPFSRGKQLWISSRNTMGQVAESLENQEEGFIERTKAQMRADLMGAGVSQKEADLKVNRFFLGVRADLAQADAVASGRYNKAPLIAKDVSTIKTWMLKLGEEMGISGTGCDINLDRGHSYCRELYFHFGRLHTKQSLESTFSNYEGSQDNEYLLQNYERLSELAQKERDFSAKTAASKCRLMRSEVFSSKLFVGELWSEKSHMWTGRIDDEEEEIWCTIDAASTGEGGKSDVLLQNEAKWMDINDLARIEEVLDQTTNQYGELFLSHKNASFGKRDSADAGVDLTALDTLNKSQDSKQESEHEEEKEEKEEVLADKKEDWKHVIKSYLIERLLLHREYKRKIGYALNYFCSVQRRLTQDIIELTTSHSACESSIDIKSSKPSTAAAAASVSKMKSAANLGTAQVPPPLFHEASGQPLTVKSGTCTISGDAKAEARDEANKSYLMDLKLVRIDKDEVRLADHSGVYVFLQGATQELAKVMERVLRAGSYYILQRERMEGAFKKKQKPIVDRGLVLLDLLRAECEFQYQKVWAVEKLMYVYEHTTDLLEIQNAGQQIYDVISRRPRLHLVGDYFLGAYEMEAKSLGQYNELLTKLIVGQVREEVGIDAANDQAVKRKVETHQKLVAEASQRQKTATPINGASIPVTQNPVPEKLPADSQLPDPYLGVGGESHKKRLEEILELEPKKEQDLFDAHRKALKEEVKDEELEDMFDFAAFYEGWHCRTPAESPSMEDIQFSSESSLPKFKLFSFHSSLSGIVQILQAAKKAVKTISKHFQSESGFAVAALEFEVLRVSCAEYERVQSFLASPPDGLGSSVKSIEQAQVADSPEVLMFCAKELAASFSKGSLAEIDPTLIGKLSVETLKGISPPPLATSMDISGGKPKDKKAPQDNNPKYWPNLLTLCCNLVEFTRIRERLIESIYESYVLGEVYKSQQSFASQGGPLILSDSIGFATLKNAAAKDLSSPKLCDDCKLGLPVKEFEPTFQHLLCFHKLDCLKHSLFDLGLEEIRGVLHYQMMHLQLLQMAVHMNQWIYLPYIRASAEIEGATGNFVVTSGQKKRSFSVPNGVLGLRTGEDGRIYAREKENVRDKMMRALANCFVDASKPRYQQRSFVQTAFQTFLAKLQTRKDLNPVSAGRALKSYKLYLLHVYCDRTLKAFYELGLHTHIFEAAQSLRKLAMTFPEDELLFDCRKSFGLEAVPFGAGLSLGLDEIRAKDSGTGGFSLKDTLLRIPSTEDIAVMVRAADRQFAPKFPEIQPGIDDAHPESGIKEAVSFGDSTATKKRKKWLRNDSSECLCGQYESSAFETLNGMVLIRNALMLEVAIEGTHVPPHLWLTFLKDFRMNIVPWKRYSKRNSVLDSEDKPHAKVDRVLQDELYAEHRLETLEHMLRSLAHKVRVMDCALYKTCGFNTASVLDYFTLYYKYKYMCLAEGLFKLLDDVPAGNKKDECWTDVTRAVNHMLSTRLSTPTYVGADGSCFRFVPHERLDLDFADWEEEYQGWYVKELVPERFGDPDILKIISDDLQNSASPARIPIASEQGELPLTNLFVHLYGVTGNEEARKNLVSYISIVEGKAQVEYGPQNNAEDTEAEFFLLPVEVSKLEELKEQVYSVKERIRLRRFRLALMSWYSGYPPLQNLEIITQQRKVLTERTFISLMRLKEEVKFESDRFDLPRNQRLRKETVAETRFLKAELSKELLSRGIDCLKQEQSIISDLLEKGTLTLESSVDCMRGTAATLYSNVDTNQRKCILNAMAQVQSFLSQIKNRATVVESLTTGTAMVITLHDFNLSLYGLCKNLWRQYVAQYRSGLWAERKMQQQLHHQAYMEGVKKDSAQHELAATKKNVEHSIGVEVGQRCYEQIYEVERMQRQCEFWKQKMRTMETKVKKQLREELRQEILEKDLQIKNYGTQFSDYKETLMSQLKAEIASHNTSISKKLQALPGASPKRKSVNMMASAGAREIEEVEERANQKVAGAYEELANLQGKVHSLRLFYNMRIALLRGKYKEKMGLVRKTMSDNAELWNELSLAERREVILKQELVNTQQNMSGFERTLKQMQSTLKEKNEALLRFHQTKNSRAQRLEELEAKLRRCNASAGVDVDQMQIELLRKEKELCDLRGAVNMSSGQVESVKSACRTQIKWMQKKLKHEESERSAAIQKVGELQTIMVQNKSVGGVKESAGKEEGAGLWREKCKELVEICKALKNENEMFRVMLKDQQPLQSQTSGDLIKSRAEDESKERVDTPYSQGIIGSANYTRIHTSKGMEKSMNVIGTGANNAYAQKQFARPGVQTRASSQSGVQKSRASYASRDPIPPANMRPQTQHHPFFVKRRSRLSSSGVKGRHMQNLSYYPPSDTQ